MLKQWIAATCFLFISIGCAETRTYRISVQNHSSEPVIAWLTKDGPPYETGWKAPEDIAIEYPRLREPIAGVTVPPGQTRATEQVGQFDSRTNAILRIYGGTTSFADILSVSRGSSNRFDVPLHLGNNQFIITDKSGLLSVQRVGADGAGTEH